ncbi:MAG: rod shape-determining protein [Eubacterium sp.]|jgi:cell division protein FtsA|nr:rod shape-determining protein [Eubacterium sp.]
MGKISDLKGQGDAIFSLDIGTRTVVGIYGEAADEMFALKDYVVEEHPKRAMIDGQIEDIKQVAKVVSKVKETLEERNGIKFTRVSIAAAGRALKTRHVSMEFDIGEQDIITGDMIKSMEIETVQRAQSQLDEEHRGDPVLFYCVGHSIVKYCLDGYKIINLEGHKGITAKVELIATFLPNLVVEGLYSVMDLCGLEVTSLTLEPIAAMNVIIPQEIRLINIALADIGAGTSDIAISKDGSIVAYSMATLAGDEITEEIIKTFFVDFKTAEQMKHDSTGGKQEIEFRDIFGLNQTIKTDEFVKKLDGAVETLAKTICGHIVEANGGPVAAVFLVGGGSLITGLSEKVSDILKLDPMRVAIGTSGNFRTVDIGAFEPGAEFATPLGIAVTEILNKGYDFSTIELNGEKIRIFDTKQITIFDLLTMAGYRANDIIGRSGRSLTFTFAGRRKIIKGGNFIPPEITVNGLPTNLNAHVTQGDKVDFKPAVCGENGSARLSDIYDFKTNDNSYVIFAGERIKIGVSFTVKGKPVDDDYKIQPYDEIETQGILTLGDLLSSVEIDSHGTSFTVNGEVEPTTVILQDGDIIDYEAALTGGNLTSEQVSQNNFESDVPPEEYGEITLTLNGESRTLPATPDHTRHLLLELLNFIDYDQNGISGYTMLINKNEAGFNSQIKSGDEVEIELK